MYNRMKKWISYLVIVCLLAVALPVSHMTAYAASAKISFSDPTVTVGQEVSVTMKISSVDGGALGGSDVMVSYDASMLEFISGGSNANGGVGAIRLLGTMDSANTTSFSYTLTFKSLQAGTTQLKVTSQEVYDVDLKPVTMDKIGNSTVTINAPATYSSDASLASLEVSPGKLSPAFSPDVTNYTASVGNDISKIVVSAGTSHPGAKKVVSGNTKLKAGENKVVCKVTAEDGKTVKEYMITVTKAEGTPETTTEGTAESVEETTAPVAGELNATIDGMIRNILPNFDGITIPEGFEVTPYTYKGNEIQALKGIAKSLLLLNLADESGAGKLYVLNEQADSFYPFNEVSSTAKSVTIIPLEDGVIPPEGYIEINAMIDEQTVKVWVDENDIEQQFYVFYGMNWDGDKNLYRYDSIEKTVQRYVKDSSVNNEYSTKYNALVDQHNKLIDDYEAGMGLRLKVIIGLGIGCLLLLCLFLGVLFNQRKRGYKKDEFEEDEEEEMDFVERALAKRLSSDISKAEMAPSREAMDDFEEMEHFTSDSDINKSKDIVIMEDGDDDFEFLDLDEDDEI